MRYTSQPVEFEIYNNTLNGDLAAKVTLFDAESATIEIKEVVDNYSWTELSQQIQICLNKALGDNIDVS